MPEVIIWNIVIVLVAIISGLLIGFFLVSKAIKALDDYLQPERIALQAERDKLADERIALQAERDKLADERIALQAERDKLAANLNKLLHPEDYKLQEDYEKIFADFKNDQQRAKHLKVSRSRITRMKRVVGWSKPEKDT